MENILKNSINRLDIICWTLVVAFFCGYALVFNCNLNKSLMAASGIVLAMMFIGLSIEIIIDTLGNVKGIGTITGFIINGPELVCLVVGLLAVGFYAIQIQDHLYWLITASLLTIFLFIRRPEEEIKNVEDGETDGLKSLWPIIPAGGILITAGYFLDPIVTFAPEQNHAPKGVIGFFILASV